MLRGVAAWGLLQRAAGAIYRIGWLGRACTESPRTWRCARRGRRGRCEVRACGRLWVDEDPGRWVPYGGEGEERESGLQASWAAARLVGRAVVRLG